MIVKHFFEHLGRYLYVLAKSDGYIQKKEEDVLMTEILDIIKEYPGFEKNSEVQGLLLTKLCYYNREKEDGSLQSTADDFLIFIRTNQNHISDLSKEIALRLIMKLAFVYKGISKAEQKMLQAVKAELEFHARTRT